MMGVDEEILFAITGDLRNLSPERVRVIIEFAILVSFDPKAVSLEQYDQLRDFGISDSEIVEIIMVAGMGRMGDTLADSLKVEVDDAVREMLGR
jgi:alkylhydroperoxidase family enzyme